MRATTPSLGAVHGAKRGVVAVDEAYLDLTENRRGLPSASVAAKEIRAHLPRLTASAGVSYNKFLAKLAAGTEAMTDEVWAWCEKVKAFGRTVRVK
jgi:nucleotidyltransferase/DNA polymerase involved in DNA repair